MKDKPSKESFQFFLFLQCNNPALFGESSHRKCKRADISIFVCSSNIDQENEAPEENHKGEKEKDIASLCHAILDEGISKNKDALFALLGLESDGIVDQEIDSDLKLFLDLVGLVKFKDVLNYLEDNKEAGFIQIIEKDFEDYQKQNPHIQAGSNCYVLYAPRYTLKKKTIQLQQNPQEMMPNKWLEKLPNFFDIPDWESFRPSFPKQPNLVIPLDITAHKQDNSDIKTPSRILYGFQEIYLNLT